MIVKPLAAMRANAHQPSSWHCLDHRGGGEAGCTSAAIALEMQGLTNCRRMRSLLVMNFRVRMVHDFSAILTESPGRVSRCYRREREEKAGQGLRMSTTRLYQKMGP